MLSRTRPLGVTIIAILVAIGGVLSILSGLLALATFTGLGLISLIFGVVALVLAWGLWTLQPWAFWTTIVIEAIGALENLINLIQGNGGAIIGLIIAVAIIAYMLYDRNVRAAFRT